MGLATYNERSWAIDLIGHLNQSLMGNDLAVRRVSGEQGISAEGSSRFPDMLLFGDQDDAVILQGWELKFPDTDINDPELLENAALKARSLGLDSFVVWNVRYAALYILDSENGEFVFYQQWDELHDIDSRAKVRGARARWEALGAIILASVNSLLANGDLQGRPFVEAYRTEGLSGLIAANSGAAADHLRVAALANGQLRSEIALWWSRYQNEYDGDDRHVALAKANLLNWMNKFLLAHILRERSQHADRVVEIDKEMDPADAIAIFSEISEHCNFWTAFSDGLGLSVVPPESWRHLCEFNRFLSALRIATVDQGQVQALLETSASVGNRKLRGQYTTPAGLANLLVHLAIDNIATDRLLDPCCGSGTIARAALDLKLKNGVAAASGASQIYASDLDRQAVQLATFSLSSPLLMREPLRIFGLDAFALSPDLGVQFRDPNNGQAFQEQLGTFQAIASNLPFVAQDGRRTYGEAIDRVNLKLAETGSGLTGRADIAAYLPFAFYDLLEPGGRLVILITNAWLGTEWGQQFFDKLRHFYRLRAVVTSGAGRWFENAKIVTNILVLEKPVAEDAPDMGTNFVVLKQTIDLLEENDHAEAVAAQILLGQQQDDMMTLRSVTHDAIVEARPLGLDGMGQFVDCDWIAHFPLVPANTKFRFVRGQRRGWDGLFYPNGDHSIEYEYLCDVVLRSTAFTTYGTPNRAKAFVCSATLDELRQRGHLGALNWIERFANARNGSNRPLPEALQQANLHWYQMEAGLASDLVIPINFGDRLFVGHLDVPVIVNQRFTVLNARDGTDVELAHALLNSTVGLFMIEAIGFGRGQGALDLNKDRLGKHLHMIDPSALSAAQRGNIVAAFATVRDREILNIADELEQQDRIILDDVILEALGAEIDRESVYEGLRTLNEIRQSVKD
jgi:N-6 DNA Methylase